MNNKIDAAVITALIAALITAIVAWLTCCLAFLNARSQRRADAAEKSARIVVRDVVIAVSGEVMTFGCLLRNVGPTCAEDVRLAWRCGGSEAGSRFLDLLAGHETLTVEFPLSDGQSSAYPTVDLTLRYRSFDRSQHRSGSRFTFSAGGGCAVDIQRLP